MGRPVEFLLELVPYLEKEMLTLRAFVGPGGTCFDIGAAGGVYAYLMSRLVGPDGHVYAFEPRPNSFRLLEAARRRLGLANVTIVPLALGESQGTEAMVVPERHRVRFSTRSFLKRDLAGPGYPEFTGGKDVQVRTTTLDAIVRAEDLSSVDFVKCDVEGAEPWVLQGGRLTIERHRPVILCEVEERHLGKYRLRAEDLLAWVAEFGYRPFAYRLGALRPVSRIEPKENNYLFLPAERYGA